MIPSSSIRIYLLILIDALIVTASAVTSYLFRFDGKIPDFYMNQMLVFTAVSVVITTALMYVFHLYHRIWQYASVGEIISITKTVTIACLTSYLISYLFYGRVPVSIALRNYETVLICLGGSRFIWRIYRDHYIKSKSEDSIRAMIVGAGDCGVMIAREMKTNASAKLYPVVFIDDDPSKHRNRMHGIPIVGGRDSIPEMVEKHRIDEIIIAMPSISRSEYAHIIDICKRTKATLKTIPMLNDLIDGKVTLNTIRQVEVEDLLGRDPVQTDLAAISSYIQNKVVLITGAGGSIGSELSRQIAMLSPHKLLLLGHGENSIYAIEIELRRRWPDLSIEPIIADIQDRDRIDRIFSEHRPHVVFHAAAHKHVPLMERNPSEAVKNNVFGTKNVADSASKYDSERFVLVSSDKAVHPSSVMGTTKRIAEMYIQSLNERSATNYAAVRFGNVLGSRGSVIPLFKEQIARGGPVTVTHHDMVRYFMTIPEAVQLVIQAGALSEGGEIFILDMGQPVRILELAEDLIRLSGFEPYQEIDITFTGVRAGEKLFEELMLTEEQALATKHDRIFVGKSMQQLDYEVWDLYCRNLERCISEGRLSVRAMLEEMVPSPHREAYREVAATASGTL